MFEKTLSDLVRGIRSHKGEGEAQYIVQCLAEIKTELKQENAVVKANAVSKLTYLQMLGYDISWAAFNIIEVMSNPKFSCKRIGYLAASQCFHETTDVVMLCTNLIRKDLSSGNIYDASLALNGLACFVTTDLARDLANDVLALTVSSKPYLRKKSLLVLYKIFLKFPDALRPAFPRLKEKLEDPESSVQCAAVSVICELARKNPKNYLSLAPTLFKLMQASANNWMLIKIIKLFAVLTPLEPRLSKKLQEPLTTLIHSTSAMSLLYECVSTMISGMPKNVSAMQLCVSKLRLFVEDVDQNLRYLGLLAMSRILPHQPKAVLQLKDLVMECLESHDESIRLRALDLIVGMINKKNLMEIVRRLLAHVEESESVHYRDEVVSKIITMCKQGNYQYITNFEWYITVLVEMTKFESTKHGQLIASQMLDVTIRVKDVRPFSIKQMAIFLDNCQVFLSSSESSICEVLYAAAWLVGEFCVHLPDPQSTLDAMLSPKVTSLPGHVQAVFVQNILKLYSSILVKAESQGEPEAVEEVGAMLVDRLPNFIQSGDLEVQERACCILQLMKYIVKLQEKGASVGEELALLFAGDLNPVAPKAQKKVPVPEGLDLDKWINEPPPESDDENFTDGPDFTFSTSTGSFYKDDDGPASDKKKRSKRGKGGEDDEDDSHRKQRELERKSNPHYLPMGSSKKPPKDSPEKGEAAVETVPVSKVNLGSLSLVIDQPKDKKGKKGKKAKKGRKGRRGSDDDEDSRPQVLMVEEDMPDGARQYSSDEDTKQHTELDAAHKLLNVDLSAPLRDDEALPVRKHREVPVASLKVTEDNEGEKKRKKKKKDKNVEEEGTGDSPKQKHKGKKDKGEKKKKTSKKKKSEDVEEPEDTSVVEVQSTPNTDEQGTEPPRGAGEEGSLDDLEFWLSESPSTTRKKAKEEKEETPVKTAPPQREQVEEEEEKGKKKGKKTKGDKSMEKAGGKKKKKSKKTQDVEEESEVVVAAPEEDLMKDSIAAPVTTQYLLLAEDDNIKMTYKIRPHLINSGTVYIPVLFDNLTDLNIVSLNFNVLDSLNTKLERVGMANRSDGVPIPFNLLPGMSNEYQFIFSVKSVNMPQRLRGTLTYMIKSDSGTTSEKLDFKLSFPCSGFITPVPCPRDDLAALLQGGELCDTQTRKVTFTKVTDFNVALATVARSLNLAVVEQVEDGASLHGISINNDHVCVKIKAVGSDAVLLNAKGSDSQLISHILDEVKTFL